MPKFSLIIPTYNSEKTIKETIDSILKQSFNDYEILIIDGMSSDNTLNILKKYRLKNSKIGFIHEKDKGIYDAMNKGIEQSKGEWLYFMGSDDTLFNKDVLNNVSKLINKQSYDIIYGNVIFSDTKKRYDGEFTNFKLFLKNISHQAIFYKKNIFEKYGLYEYKYKIYADYVLNMKWFTSRTIKRAYLNIVIANFYANGLSSQQVINDPEYYKNRVMLNKKHFSIFIRQLYKYKNTIFGKFLIKLLYKIKI